MGECELLKELGLPSKGFHSRIQAGVLVYSKRAEGRV